jgi:hypothetical protein
MTGQTSVAEVPDCFDPASLMSLRADSVFFKWQRRFL